MKFTREKPIHDITFTGYNGIALTLLRTPNGKWMADIGSGKASLGPLSWTALVASIEFNMSDANIHRTLGA